MIAKIFNFLGCIAFTIMFNMMMAVELVNSGFSKEVVGILCMLSGFMMPMAMFNWLYKQDNKEEQTQDNE